MPTRWSLARRLRAALLLLVLVLVLAGVAIGLALRQADSAVNRQTQRIFPARVAASQLLTSLVDQETALRGYELTRDRRFLEPYRQGLTDEQDARQRLERFVLPREPARLALLTVDAAITAWRDQYATFRTADSTARPSDSTIDFGRELFERVRTTNRALDTQLAGEVRRAQAQVDHARRLVVLVLLATSALVLLVVVGLQRALRGSVLRPLADLGAQVAVVAGGDHSTPIRATGPPDLRLMSGQVESMRLELVSTLAEVERQRGVVERRAADLARSNADLEQFAYVASHDLQEPLRKVASFCQLLDQRYGDQLDARGRQYLDFAVDGALRMQRLITDLLTFSRVGRTSEAFVALDLAAAVQQAWNSLEAKARETGAELDLALHGQTVVADPSLLQLLLTNLLGNAMKYHRPDAAPCIRVSAAPEGPMLRVEVADNGIGIPQEYAEKVFVIFQRLHGRDEYDGTGIGLALAKKVVEFHGGRIELRPSPLGGACVAFTLPVEELPHHD